MPEDWTLGGFGIYIHWPFCAAKCPYCDFNSHVTAQVDHEAWAQAYLEEIDRAADETGPRVVQSVFFGGGTPSLMAPDTVGQILDRIAQRYRLANDVEVTLEANPTSVEAGRFTAFRKAGVNRVSLGVQALDDDDLRALGRQHSVAEARNAFDIARNAFNRISFDLIYARQNQTLAAWEAELSAALEMAVDHLSLYQLTIEPGTIFGARHDRGLLRGLPSDDLGADMYALTQDICAAHGLPAYEVSNHASDMAQSRHNLIYWRYGDYVGIGPGAHGRLTLNGARFATEEARMPNAWLAGPRRVVSDRLSVEDQVHEMVMMGLRLRDGIDLDRLQALWGRGFAPDRVRELSDLGLIRQTSGKLVVSDQGVMVLNAVLAKLLED